MLRQMNANKEVPMKQRWLLVVTAVTVFVTGIMVTHNPLVARRPARSLPPRTLATQAEVNLQDAYATQIARRWRQGHSSHWRTLLLHQ
jgi:hypothetical protein